MFFKTSIADLTLLSFLKKYSISNNVFIISTLMGAIAFIFLKLIIPLLQLSTNSNRSKQIPFKVFFN